MSADQPRLRASHCGLAEQHAQVASNPEAPWVRIALPVHKNHVGCVPHLFKRGEQRGSFTETQQAGHIGERERVDGGDAFDFDKL